MFPSTDVRYVRIRGAPECDLQEYVTETILTAIVSLFRTLGVKWSYYFWAEGVTDLST